MSDEAKVRIMDATETFQVERKQTRRRIVGLAVLQVRDVIEDPETSREELNELTDVLNDLGSLIHVRRVKTRRGW